VSAARVEFTPEALREIDDAFEWYFERSLKAAETFIAEATRALSLIASSPAIWPDFESGTRRYVLRKFPYSVIYRELNDGIEVIAMAHHKRRPRYWRGRLSPKRPVAWREAQKGSPLESQSVRRAPLSDNATLVLLLLGRRRTA
jgi:plasmid stabilization system protein ParE